MPILDGRNFVCRQATVTSRIHILRLHRKNDGLHWAGCALNPVDIVNPHGYILGEVMNVKMKKYTLFVFLRVQPAAGELIQGMQEGAVDVEKHLVGHDVKEAPSQCLTSHNFMRNKSGLRRIESFLLELPQLYLKKGIHVLNGQGEVAPGPILMWFGETSLSTTFGSLHANTEV